MAPKKAPSSTGGEKTPTKGGNDVKPKDAKADNPTDTEAEKPEDAEDDKPTDAEDDKKSKFPLNLGKTKAVIQSPWAFLVGVLTTITVLVITIIFIPLAYIEWNNTANIREAMRMLRSFMVARDPSYRKAQDVQLLLEMGKTANHLAMSAKLVDELEDDIEDIRYRLNHDWIANKDAIYVFKHMRLNWNETKLNCEADTATMIKIESDKEEEFIEKEISRRDRPYWLGIMKKGKEFFWDSDGTVVTKFYWASDEPSMKCGGSPRNPICVSMKEMCSTRFQCWQTQNCGIAARILCKKKPNPKWMTDSAP